MEAVKNISKRGLAFFFSILFLQSVLSQNWELGGYKLPISYPNLPLEVSSIKVPIFSYPYLSEVGGVAFVETAKPVKALENSNILLAYNAKAPDGYRLTITVGEKKYNPYLPDWQLLPIAIFSESDFDACVSLFGKHSESCYTYTREKQGDTTKFYIDHFHIEYHSAFNNTLLGLRLLQSDIILIDSKLANGLPKWNGKVILGEGEKKIFRSSMADHAEIMNTISNEGGFHSYMLTDKDQNISFEIKDDTFSISGNPYYYFWKSKSYDSIESLTKLTEAMKLNWGKFLKINKPVYTAVENTMRYAAFFRFVRKNNPLNYKIFLNRVVGLKVMDNDNQSEKYHSRTISQINSPTRMPRPRYLVRYTLNSKVSNYKSTKDIILDMINKDVRRSRTLDSLIRNLQSNLHQ